MRPIILDPKSPPVPCRVTKKSPTPHRPRMQQHLRDKSHLPPTEPTSIYDRAKQQQAARELKVEFLRRTLTSECTFTPKTITRQSQQAVTSLRGKDNSVFERLYHIKSGPYLKGSVAKHSPIARPSAGKLPPQHRILSTMSTPSGSMSRHSRQSSQQQQFMSRRLENLYDYGVSKLLSRPKSHQDEKQFRDWRYETKQLQDSSKSTRYNRGSETNTNQRFSSMRMVPTRQQPTNARVRRKIPPGFSTPSPRRPLYPPPSILTRSGSNNSNLKFPSEIVVDMASMSSPDGVLAMQRKSLLPIPKRLLMDSPEMKAVPWPSSLPSPNPWRESSSIVRNNNIKACRSKQQQQAISPKVWKSASPKPWHTPLRKDYQWTTPPPPQPQTTDYSVYSSPGIPAAVSESTEEWGMSDVILVDEGKTGVDLKHESTTDDDDDSGTIYGSI
ncbi:hypothetical protein MPSEU_000909800 [Mayamaea pseudoterrestris]|nr:hypothetical protein MPSEU_000909800 [Mayamaea pseudoterrestris]